VAKLDTVLFLNLFSKAIIADRLTVMRGVTNQVQILFT